MRLSHVTLLVSDIKRSKAFYEAFGLELIVDAAHYCRFIARIGGEGSETLSISHTDAPISCSSHIGFEFESAAELDAFANGLGAKGITLTEPLQDRSWLWRDAIVHDPDGHELLLLYAGHNKLNPPWRVSKQAD